MKALSCTLEAAVLAALDTPLLRIEPIPVADAPSSLEELLAATQDESDGPWQPGWSFENGRQVARIPVWEGGSDRTIWSSPSVNHAFRALHDYEHILQCAGFDVQGESYVARAQAAKLCTSKAERVILLAETMGQIYYHERWGRFPTDQRAFVVRCVRVGMFQAVDMGRL